MPVDLHGRISRHAQLRRLSELLFNAHHAVHVTTSGMNSGVIGISWEWPD